MQGCCTILYWCYLSVSSKFVSALSSDGQADVWKKGGGGGQQGKYSRPRWLAACQADGVNWCAPWASPSSSHTISNEETHNYILLC